MSAVRLKRIERSLEEIENWREEHDHPGGTKELISELAPPLLVWGTRIDFFDEISSELNCVGQIADNDEALSTTLELQSKSIQTEHMLNVVVNDSAIPTNEADASIRYVVDDEELVSSPLIQEGLVDRAIHYPDAEIRRLAWLHICKQLAQNPPVSRSGDGGIHGKFGSAELKRLRKQFMAERVVLGPRGTILNSAESRHGAEDIIPELLTALANPKNLDRKEIAMTLGEVGGSEVAVFLADALRAEVEEHSTAEDYQVYLAAGLARLGGPQAVAALLRAAENGSERVRLSALSGLESLATGGSIALTEYPEPATIDSAEMRDAYLELAERLNDLIPSTVTLPYVRHKAEELLENVQISLSSVSIAA